MILHLREMLIYSLQYSFIAKSARKFSCKFYNTLLGFSANIP